jgi:hypothetical protein
MSPTLGQNAFFYRSAAHFTAKKPAQAAIITQVHSAVLVDTCIFAPTGNALAQPNLPYVSMGGTPPANGGMISDQAPAP